MARVQLGPVVSDLRGKVGGSIFQRTAHGLALRALHVPVNPRTVSQSSNKAAMFNLQIAWQQLTNAQRTAWSRWAEYQNLLTGQFLGAAQNGQLTFIQVNRYRTLAGETLIDDPIFTPYSLPAFTVALAEAAGTLTAQFDGQTTSDDYSPLLFLSFPLSPTRNARPAGMRFLLSPLNVSGDTWNYTAPYVAAHGLSAASGMSVFAQYGVQQTDNGALSIFTSTRLTIS